MKNVKDIPGSNGLIITISRRIYNSRDKEVLPDDNGEVLIDLYGEIKRVSVEWIYNLSWYGIKLPKHLQAKVWDITFEEDGNVYSRNRFKYIPVFNKPMEITPGKFMIPTCPDFTIDINYNVYNKYNKKISISTDGGRNYPAVAINGANKRLHRLVAYTFIPNDDTVNKYVVNHKDHDISNYNKDNLEWVTSRSNRMHCDTDDYMEVYPFITRNYKTKEVVKHVSLKQMCKFMGLHKNTSLHTLLAVRKGRLINHLYELRLADEKLDWFYVDKDSKANIGDYTIVIKEGGDVMQTFYGLKDMTKFYKPNSVYTASLSEMETHMKKHHPNLKLVITRTRRDGPYQAKALSTGNVYTSDTQTGLSKLLGKSKSIVNAAFYKGNYTVSDGIVYRIKSDEDWDEKLFKVPNNNKSIPILCRKGKVKINCVSLRDAMRKTNLDRTIITKCLKSSKSFGGWTFTRI